MSGLQCSGIVNLALDEAEDANDSVSSENLLGLNGLRGLSGLNSADTVLEHDGRSCGVGGGPH